MELPQPRSFGTQGRKPTHDFLSLYSPAHQDPSPTPKDGYLQTYDFLQPLERVGKNAAKEGNKVEEPTIGKSLPPVPPTAVERILPGGIGTYTISHISCINQTQKMPKPEEVLITAAQSSSGDKNDANSNCSSYTGSGFSLWEDSTVNKGKTGKENIAGNRHSIREEGMKIGGVPWMTSTAHNHASTTISSLSSSRPSSIQKNQSFVDMLKSGKSTQDYEEEFVIKKEPSSNYKGVLSIKMDTTQHDQKPNTLRSKHSATEQRRRSKINDRFTMLRELIPHGDQKRDKASFLLEVIEYIQFLQEKVHKYEDSFRGWNSEPSTMNPWNNNQRPSEGLVEVSQNPKLTNKTSPSKMASQIWQSRSCISNGDMSEEQELRIESGTISISTIYSQGVLSTLTKALQSSGVDLSEANISVQIDLGKRANTSSIHASKNEAPSIDETVGRSRLASTREEKSDKGFLKRFKTIKS